jgi:hypothetical protein
MKGNLASIIEDALTPTTGLQQHNSLLFAFVLSMFSRKDLLTILL